jgi:hypothetical protein
MGKHKKKKPAESKKRGRHEWTTDDQKEFLTAKIPAYLSAQSKKTSKPRSDFWAPVWEGYFGKWPLQLLSNEEKEKGQLDPTRLRKAKQVSTS